MPFFYLNVEAVIIAYTTPASAAQFAATAMWALCPGAGKYLTNVGA